VFHFTVLYALSKHHIYEAAADANFILDDTKAALLAQHRPNTKVGNQYQIIKGNNNLIPKSNGHTLINIWAMCVYI